MILQSTEEKKPNKLRRLFAEKGYYIALVLCIAAVGISGYVFIRALSSGGEDTDEAQMGVPVTVETLPEAPASTGSQTGGSTAASSTDSADGTEASAADDGANSATSASSDAQTEDATEVMGSGTLSDAEAAVREQAALTVTWPVNGEISQPYSVDALVYNPTMADWRVHEGLDIAAAEGQTVMAAQAGVVSAVYTDDYLGSVVVIDHANGYSTVYANLNTIPAVMAGDEVEAGTVIGAVSNTALGEAGDVSHLHFEVLLDGVHVDPLEYLP